MPDELVLVKRVRPRVEGKFSVDGGFKLDVQRAAEEDALREWALKPVAPFEVVAPLKAQSWSGPALYVLGRGMYKAINKLIP